MAKLLDNDRCMTYLVRRALTSVDKKLVSMGGRRCIESAGELPRLLNTYPSKTKSTGCSWSNYATLYRRIRTLHPHEVLECDSGLSTAVIAYALAENVREGSEPGRLTLNNKKEYQGWYEMAGELFPASIPGKNSGLSSALETRLLYEFTKYFQKAECTFARGSLVESKCLRAAH